MSLEFALIDCPKYSVCIQMTPFSCECWRKFFYPRDPEEAVTSEGSYSQSYNKGKPSKLRIVIRHVINKELRFYQLSFLNMAHRKYLINYKGSIVVFLVTDHFRFILF